MGFFFVLRRRFCVGLPTFQGDREIFAALFSLFWNLLYSRNSPVEIELLLTDNKAAGLLPAASSHGLKRKAFLLLDQFAGIILGEGATIALEAITVVRWATL